MHIQYTVSTGVFAAESSAGARVAIEPAVAERPAQVSPDSTRRSTLVLRADLRTGFGLRDDPTVWTPRRQRVTPVEQLLGDTERSLGPRWLLAGEIAYGVDTQTGWAERFFSGNGWGGSCFISKVYARLSQSEPRHRRWHQLPTPRMVRPLQYAGCHRRWLGPPCRGAPRFSAAARPKTQRALPASAEMPRVGAQSPSRGPVPRGRNGQGDAK